MSIDDKLVDLLPREVTVGHVKRSLRRAVADYGPGWIDPRAQRGAVCRYAYEFVGRTRRCIVGWVLNDLLAPDVIPHELLHENRSVIIIGTHMGLPPQVNDLLSAAQVMQDQGKRWGELVEELE